MELIRSWKDSLELLQPHNLKMFCLIAIKNVIDVYQVMNKPLTSRGNWIAVAALVVLIGLTNIIKKFHLFWCATFLLDGIRYFLLFTFLLGMRPSVAVKDYDYFMEYFRKYWYLLALTIIMGMINIYLIPLWFIIFFPFLSIIYMLFLLFVFDGDSTIHGILSAFKRSIVMFVYNFPVFLVLIAALSVVNVVLYGLIAFALGYFGGLAIATLLYILFTPVQVVLIINLYIKYIHSQPLLYFKQVE